MYQYGQQQLQNNEMQDSQENQNAGQQTQNNMNNVSNSVRASRAGSEMIGSITNNMNIGMNGNNGVNNDAVSANTSGNGSNDINMNSAGENATVNVSTGVQGGGVQGLGQPARGDGHQQQSTGGGQRQATSNGVVGSSVQQQAMGDGTQRAGCIGEQGAVPVGRGVAAIGGGMQQPMNAGGEQTVMNNLQCSNNFGLSPLTSVCTPLGANVQQKLREQIIKSEYIELAQLLEVNEANKSSRFTLNMSEQGQLVWEDCRPKRKVTTIQSWTTAFLTFSAIFLQAHPHRAQELLKYMSLVRTSAERYQGFGWREYDRQFRMRQQLNPQRSWGSIDSELWSLYAASGPITQSVRFNSVRGVMTETPFTFRRYAQTQINGNPGQQIKARNNIGSQVCFAFNASGYGRPQCKFQHRCSKCGATGHRLSSCKNTNVK